MASKSGIVPMVLAAVVGGSGALLLTQLYFSIWIEPSVTAEKAPPVLEVKPTLPDAMAKGRPEVIAKKEPPPSIDPRTDVLRISNQTQFPIRIVLRSHLDPNHPSPPETPHFKEPVHWDFAPQEGSIGGLKVSLPSGPMQLYQGDVLMAFALDGSQKYWGPYVVGDTPQPTLTQTDAEWHLVISP